MTPLVGVGRRLEVGGLCLLMRGSWPFMEGKSYSRHVRTFYSVLIIYPKSELMKGPYFLRMGMLFSWYGVFFQNEFTSGFSGKRGLGG